MTKEVLISIKGLQFVEEEGNEPVEVITCGKYYRKNGKHYVIYEEISEDELLPVKSVVKLSDTCLEITKKGAVNVHMMFERDKKNITYYYTQYGSLLIGVEARKLEVTETEERIRADVEYTLEINYEHIADCTITIDIRAKAK